MQKLREPEVRKALSIGSICTLSYLACYFARNILSGVTPQMLEQSAFSIDFIGGMSTTWMLCYALGQIINGSLGDIIPAKYMVSGGLMMAGVCNLLIPIIGMPGVVLAAYGLSGFFLSMIYGPIVRTVAHNTIPRYATRCSLGFTFASMIGVPMAGLAAVWLDWQAVFLVCSAALLLLGAGCFAFMHCLEKRGYIRPMKKQGGKRQKIDWRRLWQRDILRFALLAVLSGIVRTSVMFWVPTYLAQYLAFSAEEAASIFSAITLLISFAPFVNNLLLYERIFRRNVYRMLSFVFAASAAFFLVMLLVKLPTLNIAALFLALFFNGAAGTVLYSIYCPSLKDTGAVSGVTGILDAFSYGAAALANALFAGAVASIGWGNLILVWVGLMAAGCLIFISARCQRQEADARAQ